VTNAAVKEARVEHIFRYAHVFPRCVAMMGSGDVDVTPLITKTFGFEDSIRAFEFATRPPTGSVKVQIEMPS
jgi:D-xylulose reductase